MYSMPTVTKNLTRVDVTTDSLEIQQRNAEFRVMDDVDLSHTPTVTKSQTGAYVTQDIPETHTEVLDVYALADTAEEAAVVTPEAVVV